MALMQIETPQAFELALSQVNQSRIKAGEKPVSKRKAIEVIFEVIFEPRPRPEQGWKDLFEEFIVDHLLNEKP